LSFRFRRYGSIAADSEHDICKIGEFVSSLKVITAVLITVIVLLI